MPRSRVQLAPPRIAWARRLILLGALLLVAAYIIYDWAEIYGPLLVDRVEATGDLRVGALNDVQVQAAFERTRAANPADAALIFIDADHQGRKYEVHVAAPDRGQAQEQMKVFVAAFAAECTASSGRVLWTSTNASPQPQWSPTTGIFRGRLKLSLLILGLAALAAGAFLYFRAYSYDRPPRSSSPAPAAAAIYPGVIPPSPLRCSRTPPPNFRGHLAPKYRRATSD